jgi:hypothetical protein
MDRKLRTFNTMNLGYLVHSAVAYTLYRLWNVKLVEINTEMGKLVFYRGD